MRFLELPPHNASACVVHVCDQFAKNASKFLNAAVIQYENVREHPQIIKVLQVSI